MCNKNKDALTLACKEVRERWGTNCCSSCPVQRGKKKIDCTGYFDRDICLSLIKKYFRKKADIPDGWDVVKGLYYSFANLQGHNAMILTVAGQLKEKLENAGIEV